MRCRATHLIPLTSAEDEKEFLELACDLDDEHELLLKFHYDALRKLEWREPLQPTPVPSTRTSPPKKGVVAKTATP